MEIVSIFEYTGNILGDIPVLAPAQFDTSSDSHAPKERDSRFFIRSIDSLGIAASSICLVHCLAMPFIIGMLPFLGLQFLEGHTAHVWLAGFVLTFALSAVVPAYLKHRRNDILVPMLVGLGLVLYATFAVQFTFGERWELPLITTGNLILVATHLRNRAMVRCCPHNHAHNS